VEAAAPVFHSNPAFQTRGSPGCLLAGTNSPPASYSMACRPASGS